MTVPQPVIGDWYRLKSTGDLFEVVAADSDDGTIELQYFDGTVEEMDFDDWRSQWEEDALETAGAPEDWTGSVDIEPEEDGPRNDANDSAGGSSGGGLHASGFETIDRLD